MSPAGRRSCLPKDILSVGVLMVVVDSAVEHLALKSLRFSFGLDLKVIAYDTHPINASYERLQVLRMDPIIRYQISDID